MIEFLNKSGLDFTDISAEAWREYVYAGGEVYRIDEPLLLHVSESGGHRLFDSKGDSYYVAPGWRVLRWYAGDGPHFVK